MLHEHLDSDHSLASIGTGSGHADGDRRTEEPVQAASNLACAAQPVLGHHAALSAHHANLGRHHQLFCGTA